MAICLPSFPATEVKSDVEKINGTVESEIQFPNQKRTDKQASAKEEHKEHEVLHKTMFASKELKSLRQKKKTTQLDTWMRTAGAFNLQCTDMLEELVDDQQQLLPYIAITLCEQILQH